MNDSLAIPPSLAQILAMPSPGLPRYEMGGAIGPGGMPQPPAPSGAGVAPQGVQGQQMDPQMLEMHLNQFASQHPQQIQQIRQAIMQEMQSGQLTPDELNKIVQLATVAAQNPEMYPHVRKFAIQQGIATEQDLPPQYDQGLVFVLLVVARAVQQDLGGQNMMQGGTPAAATQNAAPLPSMSSGGTTPTSKRADGGVVIEAHEGEYVIPAHIVKAKGTEFFDKMLEQYDPNAAA